MSFERLSLTTIISQDLWWYLRLESKTDVSNGLLRCISKITAETTPKALASDIIISSYKDEAYWLWYVRRKKVMPNTRKRSH